MNMNHFQLPINPTMLNISMEVLQLYLAVLNISVEPFSTNYPWSQRSSAPVPHVSCIMSQTLGGNQFHEKIFCKVHRMRETLAGNQFYETILRTV